ncbi:hypothetical protein SAMN05444266_106345 [Chitinophaga jiangningensis]|uniref:PE-PGRS family protein n=1 Tax=Chitinophaga jiangningensis TaxID=1419482 RepID=A0A1M7FZN5_9BACT|nr:hypothetical protein [Chitinophaga jiangningensis]SHM09572.1 hypothetical protein SAMN05444266_106345 [Chitinophaga jiangningensis]
MRHILFATLLLIGTGLQGLAQTTTVKPQLMGHINDKKLKEASGIASSVPLKNCFWSHNDSGNKPDVFLLNNKAAVISVFNIENGTNKDWEDIAEGPGPVKGKYYVYVADIGDNSGTRDHIRIYRFPEPATKPQPKVNITADVLKLEYPDHPKDAESLMIDPISRQIYIISKRQKAVHLYKTTLDFKDGDQTNLQKLITLPFTWVVSADISKDGHHIVLKTLTTVYYWNRKNGETVEQAMARPGKQLPYEPEAQGEAITILPDNSGYVTISEGKAAPMYFYKWKF